MKSVVEYWDYVSQYVEGFYRDHTGLVAVVTLVVAVVALFPRNTKRGASETGITAIGRATRLSLLDEVEQRANVGHGLREAIRIDLNLTETPAAVPVDLRIFGEFVSDPPSERATRETIQCIFKRASGALLILGEPGTGKTNLLLELARDLVAGARNDLEKPIPILFSLTRWALGERDRTLSEWMKEDLHELYSLTLADAEALIRNDGIIPLLDGLDEVDEQRRIGCVQAINKYQNARSLGRFAVCCRVQEYARLLEAQDTAVPPSSSRINARTAVRVERLSASDVERQISRPGLEHVRRILMADPVLQSFVTTPLWLHVLYLGISSEPASSDADNPRDRLYDHYVAHIVKRRPGRARHRRTDSSKLLPWLGWLAAEMQRRHQTQFILEKVDFSWLAARSNGLFHMPSPPQSEIGVKAARKEIRFVHRALFGIVVGLTGLLAGGWAFGVLVATIAGLRLEGRVEAAERLKFEWRRAISRWRFSLGYGAVFAVAFGWFHGPIGGLYVWLIAAIFEMFQGGFQPRSGDGESAPNRATRRSLRYALRVALAGGVIASLAVIGARAAVSSDLIAAATQDSVDDAARWVAFAAIILGGEKGGWFAIRHYAVRALLWRQGAAPAAYVRFLDEAVERLFLIRRGGSYEFIHLTFRDYMAAKYGTDHHSFQQPKNINKSKNFNYPRSAAVLARLCTSSWTAYVGLMVSGLEVMMRRRAAPYLGSRRVLLTGRVRDWGNLEFGLVRF